MAINNYNSTFNGPVNQAEGDQYIAGHGMLTVTTMNAQRAAADLRTAILHAHLPPGYGHQAFGELDAIDSGLNQPEPDRGRVAHFLDRLTRLLGRAGVLVSQGGALVEPLKALARLLGDAGGPILRLLPA